MTIGIGFIVGVVLGLTGAGGSMLAVPLLMWALDVDVASAAPLALLAISVAAWLGTVLAWRQARVRYRAAALMGAVGIVTAPLGFGLAHQLPQAALALLLALAMGIVAARMLVQARVAPAEARFVRANLASVAAVDATLPCKINPDTGRIQWTVRCGTVLAAIGAVAGFLAGLLGVGGGFVIVPGLRSTTDLSMPAAVATSLMVIAITSTGAVIGHLAMTRAALSAEVAPFVAGTVAGMLAGVLIAPRLAGPRLQQVFALAMAAAAAVVSIGVLRGA